MCEAILEWSPQTDVQWWFLKWITLISKGSMINTDIMILCRKVMWLLQVLLLKHNHCLFLTYQHFQKHCYLVLGWYCGQVNNWTNVPILRVTLNWNLHIANDCILLCVQNTKIEWPFASRHSEQKSVSCTFRQTSKALISL